MPKISIIVPVYNVEKYLPKCLDSLINQTLKDIEIIAVNDGSTDNSLSVLKEYAQKDSRIVIIDKENSGPGACRNIGIEKAKGEFIQFVDSDDWIEPETCEVCYQKAIEHNVGMVSFNAKMIHSKKTTPLYYYNTKKEKLVSLDDTISLLFKSPFHSWHFLLKKDFLTQHQIKYPENIFWCEDVPFVLRCWLLSNKVILLPNSFYNYIRRCQSITFDSNRAFDILTLIPFLKKVINPFVKKFPILKKESSCWITEHLFYAVQKLKNKKDKIKFKRIVYQIGCSKEYLQMLRKYKEQNKKSVHFKLFGIFPILSIRQKNEKRRYKFFGIPLLTIKHKGNITKYTCFKICLVKMIKK